MVLIGSDPPFATREAGQCRVSGEPLSPRLEKVESAGKAEDSQTGGEGRSPNRPNALPIGLRGQSISSCLDLPDSF